MRRGLFLSLVGSAAINIVLLAAFFSLKRPAVSTNSPDAAGMAAPIVQTKFTVVPRKQFFTWSEVESPDYRMYIGHLREIGCPEQTIRDIVIADVNQLYQRKRLDEVPTVEQEWWRTEPDTNLIAAASEKEQALERERRDLLDGLLGPNWSVEEAERPVLPLNGPVLGDLSADTKQAVRDIVARAQKKAGQISTGSGRTVFDASVAAIEQQERADLAKVLTPAQMEEFLLRYSLTAEDLRNQLRGIEVTPDQFRKMFELTDPIIRQIQATGLAELPEATRTAQAKQLDDIIKNTIGPDQYQALQLAQDPLYREAAAMAATNDAPTNVVNKLYQVKLLTKQEQDRIKNDPTLTPDQKAAQLEAVEAQAKSFSDQLLGLASPDQQSPPMPPPPPPPMAIHQFAPGETLDLIALRYGVPTSAIIAANPNLDLRALPKGTPIRVPLSPPASAPAR